MIDIRTEPQRERIREVAQLLQYENNHLHNRVRELLQEISELKGTNSQKQLSLELERLPTNRSAPAKCSFR